MEVTLTLNGQPRTFEDLQQGAALAEVIAALGLKPDRIAVEHQGEIVPRSRWPEVTVKSGDKLEVVHFVGGGHDGRHPA